MDKNNNLFAYEADGSQDSYIPKDFVAITDEEADAIRLANQPVVPKTFAPLSAWQVRKVLTQFELRTQVEAAISQSDQNTKDAWQYASLFERDNAVLAVMALALGLSNLQIDSMFEIGITL